MARDHLDYYGLIFGCPMGLEHEDCVYKELRNKPLGERVKFIGSITKEERSVLVKYHKDCIARRENKVPFSRIAIL